MSGHVIYACSCLNIKIHLSSKYSLNNHASERQQYWYEQENPTMEGWKVELGMGGVVIAYNSLIETRTDQQWMTVSCLNCDTDKVYSTHTKIANNTSITLKLPSTSALQSDDFAIIHKDTLFGSQIDEVRQDDQFSEIFDIKLNTSTPTNLDNNLNIPEHLTAQHQQVYQVLEKALDKMRLDSEVRIEQWKRVEMERLEEQTKIARQQSNQLWQKVLQANLENPHQFYRKSSVGLVSMTTSSASVSSLVENSNHSSSVEDMATIVPSELPNTNTNTNTTNTTTTQSESSIDNIISTSKTDHDQTSSKKSHVVRFKENMDETKSNSSQGSYRRPSFSLDESAIANSLGKQENQQVENIITFNKHLNNVIKKDDNQEEKEDDEEEEEEDMFDLDEEILSENGIDVNEIKDDDEQQQHDDENESLDINNKSETLPSSPKLSIKDNKERRTSWIKKKKSTGKYIDYDENEEKSQVIDDHEPNDETQDLSHSISKFATSVPIDINSTMHTLISPSNNNDNIVEPQNEDPTNIFDNDINNKSMDQDIYFGSKPPMTSHSFATTSTTTASNKRRSFINYDLSFSDRAASRLFPDYNAGRRKSVATTTGRQPQLDALIEKSSLDTRSMKRL